MKRILLVEDENEMRRNMATILRMEGYEVITAPSGPLGLRAALDAVPDLVLCDIMMPEMDGYGVLEGLRGNARTRGIPFIFLTAKGEKPDIRQGMNLGADDYLTKPVTIDDLMQAITARLARSVDHREAAAGEFDPSPDFSSPAPLQDLGLTLRQAEVALWVAQGKSNAEIAGILTAAEATVKKHLENIFEKLGVENRHALAVTALARLARKTR